ncbi:4'-phosphopantetheinyl transferase family protein [Marinimicrobium alkaliphilum]|uniref:4'-phosphopantetheinyl transferase family protein n=1 Tax=Marinimicrobium alkaliphilum TaxID=2202654 RepID=UPI000DBA74F3|nr:4'-phosphopantetheinyl transferase superfamily protein [Marinimicrobium alkaliphilum]
MKLLPLKTVHIWLVDLRTVDDEALIAQYGEWLSDEEQQHLEDASNSPAVRRERLISRASVRWCLSQYSDSIKPAQWEFERDQKGKPKLVNTQLPLSFSVSHSGDWLAIAVTGETTIGVDIENSSRAANWRAVAKRFFAESEIEALEKSPEQRRRQHFFELWTLKEAYFKARGTGISAGLAKPEFHIDNNGSIHVHFDPSLNDNDKDWQFHHYHLGDHYSLSVALKQHHAQDADTHFIKAIPGKQRYDLEEEAYRIILR